jgi:hypothetical protein
LATGDILTFQHALILSVPKGFVIIPLQELTDFFCGSANPEFAVGSFHARSSIIGFPIIKLIAPRAFYTFRRANFSHNRSVLSILCDLWILGKIGLSKPFRFRPSFQKPPLSLITVGRHTNCSCPLEDRSTYW